MYLYSIVDSQTGLELGTLYHSQRTASRIAERLNQASGAVRYFVRPL